MNHDDVAVEKATKKDGIIHTQEIHKLLTALVEVTIKIYRKAVT